MLGRKRFAYGRYCQREGAGQIRRSQDPRPYPDYRRRQNAKPANSRKESPVTGIGSPTFRTYGSYRRQESRIREEVQDLEAEIAANPEVTVSTDIIPEDLPEWKEIEARIAEISATISDIPAADTTELTAKKRELTALLDEVKQKLNIRATIEKNAAKKAEILAREKELAQQQADLEKQEFTIDELNKARMDEVERRVNSKFQTVRFRMFEAQLNGGETPYLYRNGRRGLSTQTSILPER